MQPPVLHNFIAPQVQSNSQNIDAELDALLDMALDEPLNQDLGVVLNFEELEEELDYDEPILVDKLKEKKSAAEAECRASKELESLPNIPLKVLDYLEKERILETKHVSLEDMDHDEEDVHMQPSRSIRSGIIEELKLLHQKSPLAYATKIHNIEKRLVENSTQTEARKKRETERKRQMKRFLNEPKNTPLIDKLIFEIDRTDAWHRSPKKPRTTWRCNSNNEQFAMTDPWKQQMKFCPQPFSKPTIGQRDSLAPSVLKPSVELQESTTQHVTQPWSKPGKRAEVRSSYLKEVEITYKSRQRSWLPSVWKDLDFFGQNNDTTATAMDFFVNHRQDFHHYSETGVPSIAAALSINFISRHQLPNQNTICFFILSTPQEAMFEQLYFKLFNDMEDKCPWTVKQLVIILGTFALKSTKLATKLRENAMMPIKLGELSKSAGPAYMSFLQQLTTDMELALTEIRRRWCFPETIMLNKNTLIFGDQNAERFSRCIMRGNTELYSGGKDDFREVFFLGPQLRHIILPLNADATSLAVIKMIVESYGSTGYRFSVILYNPKKIC